jgi:prevent-host-death family protein
MTSPGRGFSSEEASQLNGTRSCVKLVSMTRIAKPPQKPARPPGSWLLQDAKARFSELVRRVRSEGPQHVTVHGRDEVVVVSAEEFRRLKGDRTGEVLIAAMHACPDRDIDIAPQREKMPVREVDL